MTHPVGGAAQRRARASISRALAALATATVATLALATPGRAATYAVDACQHPDGTPAPHDGWTPSYSGTYVGYGDACANGGNLDAAWDSSVSHADGYGATWTLTAPSDTTLASITAHRFASVGNEQAFGSPVAQLWSNRDRYEVCAHNYGCSTLDGMISLPLSGSTSFSAGVYCSGANGCPAGGTTQIGLRRIQVQLNDDRLPTLAQPTGSLMSSATVTASRSLTYTVSDAGSGVYRQRLLADGREVTAAVVDANDGRCQPTSFGSFSDLVPCKRAANGAITYDTSGANGLADGTHEMRLEVYDATNVNHADAGPWTILVDNQPPDITALAIGGTPRSGDVLTGSVATSGQSETVALQWLRAAADGSSAAAIAGATGGTYALTDADVGHKILLRVTATDHGGSRTATTSATDAPFTGKVVAEYCTDRPTGARDECGDLDGDGIRNRLDGDIDGDATANAQDPDPYDATVPAKPSAPPPPTTTTTTTTTTTPPPATTTSASTTSTPPPAAHSDREDLTASSQPPSAVAPIVSSEDPGAVPLANPVGTPGPNGAPADGTAVLSVRFEQGAGASRRTAGRIVAGVSERVRIRGSITTQQGRPIADARVYLAERDGTAADPRWHITGGTVSRSDGSVLLFTSQGGRSRDLRLVYFPQGGRNGNRASNPLSLVVRQDSTLRTSRRTLRNGETLGFRGAVRGRLDRGAAVLQLQVLLPTGWFTFQRLRATQRSGGGFTARYTFRRTTSTTRYRFRVRVIPAPGSGYAVGRSRTVSVTVRP